MPSNKIRGLPAWALAIVLVLALAAGFGYAAYRDYLRAIEQEYRWLELQARQRAEAVSAAVRSVALMLGAIADDVPTQAAGPLEARVQWLTAMLRQLPELRSLVLTDARGRVIASNNPAVIGFDAAQREYVLAHRDGAGGERLHLSRPFKTLTGITATTLSRAVFDGRGRFVGVIVATLEAGFFDAALRFRDSSPERQAALLNLQGDLLNMIPRADLTGQSLSGGIAFTEHVASGAPVSRHDNVTQWGGIRRLSVFHGLKDVPLAVLVARDRDSVLAEWRAAALQHLLGFATLACLSLLLAALVRKRERSLRDNEARYRLLAEHVRDAIWVMDLQTRRFTYVSPSVQQLRGWSAEEVMAQPVAAALTPESAARVAAAVQDKMAALREGRAVDLSAVTEVDQPHRDGHIVHTEVATTYVCDEHGQPQSIVGVSRDISERKRLQALQQATTQMLQERLAEIAQLQGRLQEQATHDALTGLFNRRHYDEHMARELARVKRDGRPLAVIMLDLDHFKRVNDTYGHAAGDEVLKAFATVLRQDTRESDIVARYGGEEFIAALPGMTLEQAVQRAERWRSALRELAVRHGELTIRITLSAGVAVYPDDGADADALCAAADDALYRAKDSGRDRVCRSEPGSAGRPGR